MSKSKTTTNPAPVADTKTALAEINRLLAEQAHKAVADSVPVMSCTCGCGATVRPRGVFVPGHDAKLFSRLLADLKAGSPEYARLTTKAPKAVVVAKAPVVEQPVLTAKDVIAAGKAISEAKAKGRGRGRKASLAAAAQV